MAKIKTGEQYVTDVAKINSNIEVLEQYIDSKTPILHRCKIHKHIWSARPNNILNGRGCVICARERTSQSLKKTNDKYISELKTKFQTVRALEDYSGDAIKIRHQCLVCQHTWMVSPGVLLQGKGCPVCNGFVIGNAPQYINSIWASEYKKFFSEFMTEEQMKSIMPHSGKKISLPCPSCGQTKDISPANLLSYGFGCICGDGRSFPNKFVYNVISQLGTKIKLEYSPTWAAPLKYDDYLVDYNIIIENHGCQHYEENQLTTRTLQEEQENDLLKYNLAQQNGINNYIVIDCRRTTLDWIKNSIMQSALPNILGFSESDIDWIEALRYATHSLVKTSAEMFNKGMKVLEIADKLQKDRSTIRQWLQRATKIGWCEYNPKQPQSIYCIEMDMIFTTKKQAAKETHTSVASIINNLNGVYSYAGIHPQTNEKLHWTTLKSAVEQGYISS